MRERILIFCGVAIFLVLFTYPLWHAAAVSTRATPLRLQLPVEARECVAPIPYMSRGHMEILISWRENAVRHGVRMVRATNGKVYDASLTHTCLGCHSRQEFCDKCHSYSGVSAPTCWQCHNESKLIAGRTP